jgi:hypothetical protein
MLCAAPPAGLAAAAPLESPAAGSMATTTPAGEEAGAVVAVEAGDVVGEVDDGRVVVVVRPEPPELVDGGDVVLEVGSGPVVVVVVEEESGEVVAPEPVSPGAVVVVVVEEEGSVVVVVVVGSVAGSVGEVEPSVVEVVSVPVPGSGLPPSARAGEAGTQTTATNNVVRARARRTRLGNMESPEEVRTTTL